MFNSAGYFRAYYCPYFANGLCERPHCHFRHVIDESPAVSVHPRAANTPALSLLGSTDKPDLLTLVREAVLQVQKEVEEDRAKLKGSTTRARESNSKQETANSAPVVKNGVQSLSTPDAGPVEYKPTPIAKLAELKKLQEHNKHGNNSSLEYVPESLSSNASNEAPGYKPSLKIPYVPASKAKQKTNVEYVPSPTVAKTVASSDSENDDHCLADGAHFSSDDDDKGSKLQVLATKTESENTIGSTDSNFDIVNRILTESKLCDSFIKSAASLKKDSKVPAKSEKPEKNSKKNAKCKIKKSSDKDLVSKKTVVSFGVEKDKKDKKSHTSTHVLKKSVSTSKDKDNKKESKTKISSDSKVKRSPKSSKSNSSSKCREKTKEPEKGILKKFDSLGKASYCTNLKQNKSSKSKESKGDSEDKSHISKTKETKHKSSTEKKTERKSKTDFKSEAKNEKIKNVEKTVKLSPRDNDKSEVNHLEPPEVKPAASAQFEIPKINPEDLDFDLDEHDTYEECLQIFNDYVPTAIPTSSEKSPKNSSPEKSAEQTWIGKKRVAHDNGQMIAKRPKVSPHFQPPPSLVMQTRFLELQKMMQHVAQNSLSEEVNRNSTQPPNSFLSTVSLVSCGKKRIAHVPNVSALLNPNRTSTSTNSRPITHIDSNMSTNSSSFQHTITKGVKRVAHMPSITTLKRPIVPPEFGSRVPNNIRQRYLNLIIDECFKIYDTEQDAFDRGLAEEKNSYERSSTRAVYLNVVANTIKRLRSEQEGILPVSPAVEIKPVTPKPPKTAKKAPTSPSHSTKPLLSHAAILGGKKAANTSFSIHKHKHAEPTITGVSFYKALQTYLLTTAQLEENGFPMPHPTDRNKAVIVKQETKKKKRPDSIEKICCRCGTSFKVTPKGVYLTKDECFYHWGRSYKFRSNGVMETRYSCCQGGHGSEKCSVAKLHVYDEVDYDNLHSYVKLLPKSPPIDGNFGVYSLDCEMCYTGFGMELTRVTVIDQDLNIIYESLVKPENVIVDYNTRFSGLKDGDLDNVSTTLRDVQAALMTLCNDKTVLIGHSLESDLKMLKLIHGTVVDTSVVFPHRLGPPFKRALRNLSAEILKKIIQNTDTAAFDGHDSKEDAVVCMELMLLKVKEDMKKIC